MTNADAQKIADMANKAEAEFLAASPQEIREWYVALPRAKRVEMAVKFAREAGLIA